jgi:hypothetical protein
MTRLQQPGAHVLTGIEEKIQDDTKLNILLVPMIVDE